MRDKTYSEVVNRMSASVTVGENRVGHGAKVP